MLTQPQAAHVSLLARLYQEAEALSQCSSVLLFDQYQQLGLALTKPTADASYICNMVLKDCMQLH